MRHDVLISVIVPVYNVAPYLYEALDSLIHQTYRKLEIILIDDGSTDGSGDICEEYASTDERIKLIHQENKGLSTARNVGLERMTGDLVAFFDPDDAYHPLFFERLKETLIRERVNMVSCRYTMHYTTGILQTAEKDKLYPEMKSGIFDMISILGALSDGRFNVGVWNKLYCKNVWKGVRFPDGHVFEDMVVCYKVICNCEKIQVIDDSLYMHRRRPGSITNTFSVKNIEDNLLARNGLEIFIKENVPNIFTEQQLKQFLSMNLKVIITIYIQVLKREKNCDKYNEMEQLKRKINSQLVKEFNEIGINQVELRTRTAYWMICYCPWLLRMLYDIYKPMRMFVLRMTGR